MPAGAVGTGGISVGRAALGATGGRAVDHAVLQEPEETAGGAAATLAEIAATHVHYGYRRLTVLLRRQGWNINAKRVYRLYDEENLKVRSVERKKITRRQRVPQRQASATNQCWSADFVSDKLADGRTIRI